MAIYSEGVGENSFTYSGVSTGRCSNL